MVEPSWATGQGDGGAATAPGSAATNVVRGGDLDVGQLWAALRARKRWVIVPTLLALAGSAVAVDVMPPRYTGETRILLQSGESYYTRPSGSNDRDGTIDDRDVVSQVQIVTSRDLAHDAIERLGLRGNPEFDPLARTTGPRAMLESFGLLPPLTPERAADKLIEEFRDAVLAFPVAQSRVLAVEFNASDPALAARGANTVAELFIEAQTRSKMEAARSAGAWLLGAIEPLRAKVAEAEARVEEFRARSGLIVSSNNNTLTQQQLADMNAQLSAARTAQAESQSRARLIRQALAAGRPLETSDVANNELVRKLVSDRSALSAQIALESRTLLPGHPRIKELTAQLANVDAEIRGSAEKAVRTFENDARVSQARVDSISAALEALKDQTTAGAESEVTLRALEREARTLRDQLDSMTTRYREAIARDAREATPADARIISRAEPPATPTFPKKLPIIFIVTASVLLVAAAWVVTRELVSGRAYVPLAPDPADLGRDDRPTGAPPVEPPAPPSVDRWQLVAQQLPAASLTPLSARATSPRPPANDAEADMLEPAAMAALLAALQDAAGQGFVCLVSAEDRADARDGALQLGRVLAERCRTVLVDATDVGGAAQPGLRDLGREAVSMADVIHQDLRSPLHLVGPGATAPGEALNDSVSRNLEALRQSYDCVLVCCDLPQASSSFAGWLAAQVEPVVVLAGSPTQAMATAAAFTRVRPERTRPLQMSFTRPLPRMAGSIV